MKGFRSKPQFLLSTWYIFIVLKIRRPQVDFQRQTNNIVQLTSSPASSTRSSCGKNGEDGWHSMPAMPRVRRDVRGNLCATGDRKGSEFLGAPAKAGGVPRVWSGSNSGSLMTRFHSHHGMGQGDRGGAPPRPTPPGSPRLTGSSSQNTYWGTGDR